MRKQPFMSELNSGFKIIFFEVSPFVVIKHKKANFLSLKSTFKRIYIYTALESS